jgi:DNA-binding NtrC family response regulator
MAKILIIDDEKAIRNALRDILEHEKHTVDEAEDGAAGLEKAKKGGYDVILLCDIKMPKMDGLEFLQKLMAHDDDVPVIMISGHGTIDTAVEALKKGAFDFIEKPPEHQPHPGDRAQRLGPENAGAGDEDPASAKCRRPRAATGAWSARARRLERRSVR